MVIGNQEPKDQFDGVLDNIESAVEENIMKFSQEQSVAEHTVITDKTVPDDRENPILRITLWSIALVMLLTLIVMMMIYG